MDVLLSIQLRRSNHTSTTQIKIPFIRHKLMYTCTNDYWYHVASKLWWNSKEIIKSIWLMPPIWWHLLPLMVYLQLKTRCNLFKIIVCSLSYPDPLCSYQWLTHWFLSKIWCISFIVSYFSSGYSLSCSNRMNTWFAKHVKDIIIHWPILTLSKNFAVLC